MNYCRRRPDCCFDSLKRSLKKGREEVAGERAFSGRSRWRTVRRRKRRKRCAPLKFRHFEEAGAG